MNLEALLAFARYNRWMNEKLFEVAAALGDDERKRKRGVTFDTIHGIFNHILVGDRIWMSRFTGAEIPDGWLGPGGIRTLDQELYADFDELRLERSNMDGDIESWIAGLTAERLTGPLVYARMRPGSSQLPLWCSVLHLFNHQTHHRGQITALLSQAGGDPGVTDLVAMLRDEHRA